MDIRQSCSQGGRGQLADEVGSHAFRRKIRAKTFSNFAQLRAVFPAVYKVGERSVFNNGGNKFRLVAGIDFGRGMLWVNAVLTHGEYDKGAWK